MSGYDGWPTIPPLYDCSKTYPENLEEGPCFKGEVPERIRPPKEAWTKILGVPVSSPIGVPAGPLLDSKWVSLAADLGFDLLTYKTIRSHEHPSHPLPNVVPVKLKGDAVRLDAFPRQTEQITITNSFGNPSRPKEFLERDIPLANDSLKEGQLLIVSVFGSGEDPQEDFAQTAAFAKGCGAKVIEANFSCPNVPGKEGALYQNVDGVFAFSSRLVKRIGETPLIIKVGVFDTEEQMEAVFLAAARAGVRAISGINTLNRSVHPPLSANRKRSGICGAAIHQDALAFVRQARRIIHRHRLDLELIATGGAANPDQLQQFLDEGAQAAMSATGMMWDPYLAHRFHTRRYQEAAHVP